MRAIVLTSALLWCAGCASGPHPSLAVASEALDCPAAELKRHEIYPEKQRIEGCGKEGIFVRGCSDYGATAECGWTRLKPKP